MCGSNPWWKHSASVDHGEVLGTLGVEPESPVTVSHVLCWAHDQAPQNHDRNDKVYQISSQNWHGHAGCGHSTAMRVQ